LENGTPSKREKSNLFRKFAKFLRKWGKGKKLEKGIFHKKKGNLC